MTVAASTGWPRVVEPLVVHADTLRAGGVHVWGTSLSVSPYTRDMLTALLAPDERERASRFHFERDHDRYVTARGRLRLLLAAYTGHAPQDLRFDYGAHGKPTLTGPPAGDGLHFNLSHSGDLALYAFTLGRDVGIDVEQLREIPEMEEIVERWFSDEERRDIARYTGDDRVRAFFTAWTRREAVLKGHGEGMSGFARVAPEGWALRTLEPAPGFVAALAVAGASPTIRCWWAEPTS